MKDQVEIINIKWEGPLTPEEAYEKNDTSDYGVYQYYGDHPVYGLDVLLEIGTTSAIGKTPEQTFGKRLKVHDFQHWNQNIQIYLGRICIDKKATEPSDKEWSILIDRAGKLLVYACWPASNSTGITNPLGAGRHEKLLILNWGKYRSLLPEVSGYRFTKDSLDGSFRPIGQ